MIPQKEENLSCQTIILDFLKSEGMTYTMTGKQAYIEKDENNVSQYKSKHYLLWTLKEMLSMLNIDSPNEYSFFIKFREKIKFSTFSRLVQETKELYYQEKIPESISCLFENCSQVE